MKKIKKVLAILILIITFVCTGCALEGSKDYEKHANLKETGIENLYYDPHTKIVYILFNEFAGEAGYGYMSPYYAGNGKPYIWENGLEEIQ